MTDSRKNNTITAVYLILAAAVLAGLIARCPYGFPSDEALYLLVPFRVIGGDIPILHEWHPTQISDIWIHPLVALFLKVTGSTDGIFLTFRYIYTVIWWIFALFCFLRLRKISPAGSAIASLAIMIYAPYNEMALYYNTIGIMTLVSSCIIVLTAERELKFQYTVAGFLLAVAITCCPYLIILFVIAAVYCVVTKAIRSILIYITAGAAAAFVIFCIYFLSRSSISSVLGSISHLTSDREHQIGIADKLLTYAGSILFPTMTAFICIVVFAILCIVIKFTNKKAAGFAITAALVIIMQVSLILENYFINSFMLAPSLLGLYAYLFSGKEEISRIFRYIWIPGLIYTFCINLSSNLGFSAAASAASVMTFASLLSAVIFARENFDITKIPTVVLAVIAAFQIGLQLNARMNSVFDKTSIRYMTETLETGSVKGIKTTPGRIHYYGWMTSDTAPLHAENINRVLILSPESWLYMDAGKQIGSYTCWSPIIDGYTIELLDEYYGLYPDKKPDAVYVESYYTDLVPLLEERGYHGDVTALGGYILYPD
ncbi:MAG: hypothetical protein J6Z43_02550 [Clostridiales bacterium]|nr:hypothetical protein [Clostridiales bacterium]